jgi:hypothetical protein
MNTITKANIKFENTTDERLQRNETKRNLTVIIILFYITIKKVAEKNIDQAMVKLKESFDIITDDVY